MTNTREVEYNGKKYAILDKDYRTYLLMLSEKVEMKIPVIRFFLNTFEFREECQRLGIKMETLLDFHNWASEVYWKTDSDLYYCVNEFYDTHDKCFRSHWLTEFKVKASKLNIPRNSLDFPLILFFPADQTNVLISSTTEKEIFLPAFGGYKGKMVPNKKSLHSKHYSVLNNYSFKPTLTYMKLSKEREKNEFYGIELEVSTLLSPYELYQIVTQIEPKQEPFFYCKSDSSVNGCHTHKMELVTNPMTYRRQRKEWRIFFAKIEKLVEEHSKFKDVSQIFDTSRNLNNGIHIHVSKTAFAWTPPRQNKNKNPHKEKFVVCLNDSGLKTQHFLQHMGKRNTIPKFNAYCRPHSSVDGYRLGRAIKNTKEGDHRASCNETSATVEVRVFQGIYDLEHLLTCLEFVKCMLHFTRECGYRSITSRYFYSHFKDWVIDKPYQLVKHRMFKKGMN